MVWLIAGYSIELVVHAACSACIRVKRIVHFAGGRSLSHFSQARGMEPKSPKAQLRQRCLKKVVKR